MKWNKDVTNERMSVIVFRSQLKLHHSFRFISFRICNVCTYLSTQVSIMCLLIVYIYFRFGFLQTHYSPDPLAGMVFSRIRTFVWTYNAPLKFWEKYPFTSPWKRNNVDNNAFVAFHSRRHGCAVADMWKLGKATQATFSPSLANCRGCFNSIRSDASSLL